MKSVVSYFTYTFWRSVSRGSSSEVSAVWSSGVFIFVLEDGLLVVVVTPHSHISLVNQGMGIWGWGSS